MRPGDALSAARQYLRRNPEELSRILRNAIGMRLGVPLGAFRWLAGELADSDKVEDLEIGAVAPGLRMAATFDLMDTRVRAGAVLYIDRIALTGDEMRLELRLEDVSLIPVETKKSQISALLVTRSLDLSRPGDLMQHLPDMPSFIVDAHANRVVIDLMRVPKLAKDPLIRHALGLMTALLTLDGIETEGDHLDLMFKPLPQGFVAAADAIGDHLVAPVLRRARKALPAPLRGGMKRMLSLIAGSDPARSRV
ncbi:hypothetical protein G6O69_04865 [Pseudenhygromyxa sp. WMMC2535]|uniref:hypothetical protein n=1 Tax=Pseudenhygromyxa sp. WMMC2535 TaxID=2712867 RepID=UPI001556F64C|nr:hypothetical protein [Pseudenhygromyxa sp. WMMC2535]NVB37151.1 hypothetical protein [Pseudenhygromyxa sp. WMMC2535]